MRRSEATEYEGLIPDALSYRRPDSVCFSMSARAVNTLGFNVVGDTPIKRQAADLSPSKVTVARRDPLLLGTLTGGRTLPRAAGNAFESNKSAVHGSSLVVQLPKQLLDFKQL